eukprot:TRINITY_DN1199_c0_g1_i3.p1 TRINITY_DN1199_c0_g1~~TRINITY_DN1199_c0_g1_i3.p1  ORF type:complete len:791 (-),score=137.49 TRINITY_DN1199_c0_g1_i3:535-2907(-)
MAPRLCPSLKHVPIGSCPHDVQCMPFGAQGSSLYRAPFVDVEDNKLISPWHDIALHRAEGHLAVVCSTPAGSWVRYELAGNEPFNPIRIRKATAGPRGGVACTKIAAHAGKTSHLAHFSDNAPWNHAFFPQTAAACTLHGTAPLQVLEIGAEIQRHTGEVYFVKPLGAIPVEEGQPTLTWKILAIAVDDPMASVLWDWTDMEEHLPGILDLIKDWLRTALCSEAGEKESVVHIQRPARLSQTLAKITEYHQTWKHFQNHRSDNVAGFLSASVPITPKLLESAWRKYTTKDPFLSIPLQPLSTHVLFDDNWLTDAYYAEAEEKVSERNALKAPPVSGFQKATRKILTFFNLTPSASATPSPALSAASRSSSNASSRSSSSTFSGSSGGRPASRNTSFGSNDGAISNAANAARKSHEGIVRPPPLIIGSPGTPPRHRISSDGIAQSQGLSRQGTEKRSERALAFKNSGSDADMANAISAINKAQEEIERQTKFLNQAQGPYSGSSSIAAAGARSGKAVDGQRVALAANAGLTAGTAASRTSSLPAPPEVTAAPTISTRSSLDVAASAGKPGKPAGVRASLDAGVSTMSPLPLQKMEKQSYKLTPNAGTTIITSDRADGEVDPDMVDHTHDHTAVLTALRVAKMHEEKHKRHARHHEARHAHSPKTTLKPSAHEATSAVLTISTSSSDKVTRSSSGRILTPKSLSSQSRKESPTSSKGSPSSKARRAAAKAVRKAREDYESHSESDTDSEDERWGGGEGGLKRRIALTRSLSYHEEAIPRAVEIDMLPKYDSE